MFGLFFQESKSFAANIFKGQVQTAQVFPYPSGNSRDIISTSVWKKYLHFIVENEKSLSVIPCLCCSHEWGAGAVSPRARATCLQILRGNFQTTVSSWPKLAWAHAHPSPSMFLPPVCRTWMIPPRMMLWRRWKITPWRAWRRWEPLACRCQLTWAALASQTHR